MCREREKVKYHDNPLSVNTIYIYFPTNPGPMSRRYSKIEVNVLSLLSSYKVICSALIVSRSGAKTTPEQTDEQVKKPRGKSCWHIHYIIITTNIIHIKLILTLDLIQIKLIEYIICWNPRDISEGDIVPPPPPPVWCITIWICQTLLTCVKYCWDLKARTQANGMSLFSSVISFWVFAWVKATFR